MLCVIGRGPLGSGMEETYQLTSALKYLDHGGRSPLLTDARFSGVSTGACIGHVGPEALAGGPIGKLRDGDLIAIEIDRVNLHGTVDLVGCDGERFDPARGAEVLAARPQHPDLAPDPALSDDTRLWALLQSLSGGTWGGCVYDVDAIERALRGPARRRPADVTAPSPHRHRRVTQPRAALADAGGMDGMIALIAHDGTKDEMLALAEEFKDQLEDATVVATATTGGVLRHELELDVRCVLSGPLGGDLQIGSMVAGGFVKLVIFLRDPLTAHAHDPDIQALLKVCDVQRVPLATNVATARLCLAALAPVL